MALRLMGKTGIRPAATNLPHGPRTLHPGPSILRPGRLYGVRPGETAPESRAARPNT